MRIWSLFGVTVLAVAGAAWMWLAELPPPPGLPPVVPASTAPPASLAAPVPPAATPVPPRFDVARVGARGMLVTAGRAAPSAEVTLLESGRDTGRARTDGRGEWVILPTDPLAPGLRELSLVSRMAGSEPVGSRESVLLLVPEPPAGLGP
ncbi:MAG: peptidoglycan-binding protein, partial [Belnapia sp.]|nr:peptidoglycan-binding protein [Belnapia sp.]